MRSNVGQCFGLRVRWEETIGGVVEVVGWAGGEGVQRGRLWAHRKGMWVWTVAKRICDPYVPLGERRQNVVRRPGTYQDTDAVWGQRKRPTGSYSLLHLFFCEFPLVQFVCRVLNKCKWDDKTPFEALLLIVVTGEFIIDFKSLSFSMWNTESIFANYDSMISHNFYLLLCLEYFYLRHAHLYLSCYKSSKTEEQIPYYTY